MPTLLLSFVESNILGVKCEQPPVPLKTAVLRPAQGIPKTGGTGEVSGDIQTLKIDLAWVGSTR